MTMQLKRPIKRGGLIEPDKDRQVADLWMAGHSIREIAELMGITHPAVQARLNRIRSGYWGDLITLPRHRRPSNGGSREGQG